MTGCRSYFKKDLTMGDYILTRTRTLLKGDFRINVYNKDHNPVWVKDTRVRWSKSMLGDAISQAIEGVSKADSLHLGILVCINRREMTLDFHNLAQAPDNLELMNQEYYPTPFHFQNLYIKEIL